MSNVTKTEAIKNFLTASTHSHFSSLYHYGMEVQVNVAQGDGERVEGDYLGRAWHGWSDGLTTWKTFRIPYAAYTKPIYEDKEMRYDLAVHAEGIGMTGWCWTELKSKWVAFDFDAIVGHSDRHNQKLDDALLTKVREAAKQIPWVTVYKSTSGSGLHLYVFLDLEINTENHHQHAALARAILGTMSALSGFDFSSKVDTCGGNMWVWHRKMTGTDGLELIKEGESLKKVPANWKDHIKVVSGKRRKVRPSFLPKEKGEQTEEDLFEELSGQHQSVTLDDDHRKLIDWLKDNNCRWWWETDHHMLVAHTFELQQAHKALGLRGIFKTLSQGTEKRQDHNCFCYPMRQGVWVVRRYSAGCAEESSWDQDSNGYTRCFLNKEPDLRITSRAHGGIERPQGGFVFREALLAQSAAMELDIHLDIPNWANSRATTLKQHKDGRLIAEMEKQDNDPPDEKMSDWLPEGKLWKRVFNKRLDKVDDLDMGNFDDVTRHIVTESGEDQGWVFKSDGRWINEPMAHIKVALQSLGHKANDVAVILGSSIFKPWVLVNVPFQPEYLGDRKWNRDAPQLRFSPSEDEKLKYDHWLMVLNHLGKELDETIQDNGWCKAHGIVTGSDYLKCWVASMFQEPLEPLPYLFFWSQEQDTGKSIFHEAIELLITCGYARADNALQNSSGFNGELANSVLCVVEETDLKRNLVAYNRIKDWVTARLMPIHKKGKTPYMIPNSSHWVQCANDHRACPVFAGDTRITMIHVNTLKPTQLIPKRVLLKLLEKEAPDFLASILRLELPASQGRLNLPVLETDDKAIAVEANLSILGTYLNENCHYVLGAMIKYGELFNRFREWVDPNDAALWTKQRMGRELPPMFPKGRLPKEGGQMYVGNISFDPETPPGRKLVVKEGQLVEYHGH